MSKDKTDEILESLTTDVLQGIPDPQFDTETVEETEETVEDAVEDTTEEVEETEDTAEEGTEETEEESEETEETEENEESEESEEVEEGDEAFKIFAQELVEQGILSESSLKDFKGDADSLFKAMANEVESYKQSYKESLPQVLRDVIENYEEGVPLDRIIEAKSRQTELDGITEDILRDNEELQEELYAHYLYSKGFSDDKVKKMVKRAKETAELEDESLESLGELKKFEKQKEEQLKKQVEAQKVEAKKQQEKLLADIKKEIDAKTEIVPGIKHDKATKDRLYDILTKPVGADSTGRPINEIQKLRAKNPVDFDMKIAELYRLGVFEDNWDKIVKVAAKKSTSKLSEILSSSEKRKSGKSKEHESSTSTDSLLSSLKRLNSKEKIEIAKRNNFI